MTMLDKLDKVLSFMTTSPFEKGGLIDEQIKDYLKEKCNFELDGDELIKILNQLILEGLCRCRTKG